MQTGDICSATERILKLRNYPRKQPYLLAALEDLQSHFGSLPEEAVAVVLDHFGQKQGLDNELSTLFNSSPDDPHAVKICSGPLCSKAGSRELITALEATPDIAIEESHCLGICNQPPVAAVNGETISQASADKIFDRLKANKETTEG